MEKSLIIILIQILIVFLLLIILTLFIRLNNAIKLEKRISKYSIKSDPLGRGISIFDLVYKKYFRFVRKQRKKIKKLFPTLVKRYDKYVLYEDVKAADYITHKLVISFILIILTIIAMAIRGRLITFIQLFVSFTVGFYLLDVWLIIEKKINRKKVEEDMLKAIIVMNNAFKSGKSTIQAVEIASNKLPGVIGLEFKKIFEEMKYGMSVETVFSRFAKRINLEEAEYLSSSLAILNRTGGNIIAVFNSIEKTLFDKKKLKEELKNSTTVSKLVVKILMFVPVIFILIIYLFDPSYFKPFFSSTLGYILLAIILIMFVLYTYLLNRIVKVNY